MSCEQRDATAVVLVQEVAKVIASEEAARKLICLLLEHMFNRKAGFHGFQCRFEQAGLMEAFNSWVDPSSAMQRLDADVMRRLISWDEQVAIMEEAGLEEINATEHVGKSLALIVRAVTSRGTPEAIPREFLGLVCAYDRENDSTRFAHTVSR